MFSLVGYASSSGRGRLAFGLILAVLLAAGCTLPGFDSTPVPEAAQPSDAEPPASAVLQDIPPTAPTIVEISPAPGEELFPTAAVTFFFDQAMDQPSIEAAFSIEPVVQGQLSWQNPATLLFTPAQPFANGTEYTFRIGNEAASFEGLTFAETQLHTARSVGFLEITQVQPESGAGEIASNAAISVVFNRPVVPLQIEEAAPLPLNISPQIDGVGEWIDSSVFVFRPSAGLPAGQTITVEVPAGFEAPSGTVLQEAFQWSFSTGQPRLLASEPLEASTGVLLDAMVHLTFSQAMDRASVESAFALLAPDFSSLPGKFKWVDEVNQAIFVPDELLAYNSLYTLRFSEPPLAAGGVPLVDALQTTFRTVDVPAVVESDPTEGGTLQPDRALNLTFRSPMDQASLLQALSSEPSVENLSVFVHDDVNGASVFGNFRPGTQYVLTVAAEAEDRYGTALGQPFTLNFNVGDYPARVEFKRFNEVLTLANQAEPQIEVLARNTDRLDLELYQLDFDSFVQALESMEILRGTASGQGELLRSWSQPLSLRPNVLENVAVPLFEGSLASGHYLLFLDSPNDDQPPDARFIVIRDRELVLKTNEDKAFIWVVDLNSGQPVPFATVQLLDPGGAQFSSGVTDVEGVLQLNLPAEGAGPELRYAASGQPATSDYGLTSVDWVGENAPYAFGIPFDPFPSDFQTYLYSDRPVYRPGQDVNFRGILRSLGESGYDLPEDATVEVKILDPIGSPIFDRTLSVSDFGTFHDQVQLSEEAALGFYQILVSSAGEFVGDLIFEVAAFRKPEFTVEVTPSSDELAFGDPLTAEVAAEFFFGGPVADAAVEWTIWQEPAFLPDIPLPVDWFARADRFGRFPFFEPLSSGEGTTSSDGRIVFMIPTEPQEAIPSNLIIEVNVTDLSGQTVNGRAESLLHPATVYFSIMPEAYTVRAGETAFVTLHSLDWDGLPVPDQPVELQVDRVTYEQTVDENGQVVWTPQSTRVNQATLMTDSTGLLRFSFVPNSSGTYRITAIGRDETGRESRAEANVWVAGQESASFRQSVSGRLTLVADQESYRPGDVARILVPSPYEGLRSALVTTERDQVRSWQVAELGGSQSIIEIPLDASAAPNVFVSVQLIDPTSPGKPASIAQGHLEIPVSADEFSLNVSMSPDRAQAQPGDLVSYNLFVRDGQGQPVEAEFSMALADLAALNLAPPNSSSPFEAFYGPRPLQVSTASSLAVSGESGSTQFPLDGIGGGGGGEGLTEVRSEFPDTAFWEPNVVTDENGRAQITLTLPDNLTTWRMDVRGVTRDTLVGDSTADLVATKQLLIRPITPRFFTAGDQAIVSAVVQNNSGMAIDAASRLEAAGAEVHEQNERSFRLEPGGQQRLEWMIAVGDESGVDLTFHVEGGGLQDASKPTIGNAVDGVLPVLRASAPDTSGTSGSLTEAGERVEVINLPRSIDATQGGLRTILDLSLGAAIEVALLDLEANDLQSTEQMVSRLLPRLSAGNILPAGSGGTADDSIPLTLQILQQRQNFDGGWGWWPGGVSDSYLTAYTLLGVLEARAAGFNIPDEIITNAVAFLQASVVPPGSLSETADRDRLAFVELALSEANAADEALVRQLAEERGLLSIWGKAVTAQALHRLMPTDPLLPALLADLEGSAIRSATGVHWETGPEGRKNLNSAVTTTAQAIRAIQRLNPENSLTADAVRWLLASRGRAGGWPTSHDTAWAVISISEWSADQGMDQVDYTYSVLLNGLEIASGRATTDSTGSSIELEQPISALAPDSPNTLTLGREQGPGSLFYTSHLTVFQPIGEVEPTARGLSVNRSYFKFDGRCDGTPENPCLAAESALVGDQLLVRVSIVVPTDQFYVVVEDPYPAGAEPVELNPIPAPFFRAGDQAILEGPSSQGSIGGSLQFSRAELRDERLVLFAEFLPAGTYYYTYVLQALHEGEYQVLPTVARAEYFPEVFGRGAGRSFSIGPQQ